MIERLSVKTRVFMAVILTITVAVIVPNLVNKYYREKKFRQMQEIRDAIAEYILTKGRFSLIFSTVVYSARNNISSPEQLERMREEQLRFYWSLMRDSIIITQEKYNRSKRVWTVKAEIRHPPPQLIDPILATLSAAGFFNQSYDYELCRNTKGEFSVKESSF